MTPLYVYVLNLLLVLILVLANGFFVVSEFSIVKIRKTKLTELAQNGNKKAQIALKVTTDLDRYLSATQLGVTLSSLGLGWVGEPAVSKLLENLFSSLLSDNPVLLHSLSFGIAFSLITLFHVVLGELIPKSLAIQKTEKFVLLIAYPLYIFNRVFGPFIWIFDHLTIKILSWMGIKPASDNEMAHSEEEIKLIVDASQRGGIIDDTESEIIQNAIDFSETCAHEIMIPRQEMKCLDVNMSYQEGLTCIKNSKHTRYPLCEKDRDNIVGMIHIRDLLESEEKQNEPSLLLKIKRPVLFVPENKSISEILHQMMRAHTHMAIVVDEYGGTAGMLSMEDILEVLVGDIMDEHDISNGETMKKISDTEYEFDGLTLLEDAFEFMELPFDEHEESTIGGYVFGLLGQEPKLNDRVEDNQAVYEVSAIKKMRITHVKVKIAHQTEINFF